MERMREVISETQSSNVSKPVLAVLTGVGEELYSYFVKDIIRQVTNHNKQAELLLVKEGFTRQASC